MGHYSFSSRHTPTSPLTENHEEERVVLVLLLLRLHRLDGQSTTDKLGIQSEWHKKKKKYITTKWDRHGQIGMEKLTLLWPSPKKGWRTRRRTNFLKMLQIHSWRGRASNKVVFFPLAAKTTTSRVLKSNLINVAANIAPQVALVFCLQVENNKQAPLLLFSWVHFPCLSAFATSP